MSPGATSTRNMRAIRLSPDGFSSPVARIRARGEWAGRSEVSDFRRKIVLFLCTGNYYRSRFAEIIFNYLARRDRLDWEATSRGLALELAAGNAGPISRHTLAGLNTRGIQLDKPVRYPLPLDGGMLTRADHIVALKQDEHLPLLQQRF